jgi:hypothetical protein
MFQISYDVSAPLPVMRVAGGWKARAGGGIEDALMRES